MSVDGGGTIVHRLSDVRSSTAYLHQRAFWTTGEMLQGKVEGGWEQTGGVLERDMERKNGKNG